MTREQVERGLERAEKYFENSEYDDPYACYTGSYREAFIRALMEFDENELDYESYKWFVKDESKHQEMIKKLEQKIQFCEKFFDKLNEYYDELEQKEEDDEEDTMDNL